ncbi:hypothetical protein RND81_09G046000 [Saponaria officinalis]|uniref:Secreted protein n=1 Tax=Saponaria officinalis TaxID=3572 RepID=A0AAW1IGL9_SAPOF
MLLRSIFLDFKSWTTTWQSLSIITFLTPIFLTSCTPCFTASASVCFGSRLLLGHLRHCSPRHLPTLPTTNCTLSRPHSSPHPSVNVHFPKSCTRPPPSVNLCINPQTASACIPLRSSMV